MPEACSDIVRLHDRDRYIATLFAPDEKRDDLFALYAFAAELARIPTLVSEPMIGEVRLQWWADTVEAIAAQRPLDHPVAQAFGTVVQRYELPITHINTMINARRNDLYADQFASLTDLEAYVAETDAALMQFACMVLDRKLAATASALVGSAATAFGLAKLIATRNAKFIPVDETIESVTRLALKRLVEARNETAPEKLLPAILPATLTEHYARRLPSALRSQWTLWWAAGRARSDPPPALGNSALNSPLP